MTRTPGPARFKATVLVVDDEEEVREILSHMLRRVGHRVRTASDGRAAFELIATNGDFDAILCDICMPVLDGVSLFQRLRAMLGTSTPFAYVTADDSRVLGDLLEHRSQKVFCKPFEIDAILGWLDEVMAVRRGAAHPKPPETDAGLEPGKTGAGALLALASEDAASLHAARLESVAFPEMRVRVHMDRAFRVGAVFLIGANRDVRVRVATVSRSAGPHVTGVRDDSLFMTLVALVDDAKSRDAFQDATVTPTTATAS
jgi:CheY-like chemotaxis protein